MRFVEEGARDHGSTASVHVEPSPLSACTPSAGTEGRMADVVHAIAVAFRIGFARPPKANRSEAGEVRGAIGRHGAGSCLAATRRAASQAGGTGGFIGAPVNAASHGANAATGALTDVGSTIQPAVGVDAARVRRRAGTTPLWGSKRAAIQPARCRAVVIGMARTADADAGTCAGRASAALAARRLAAAPTPA